MRDLSPTTVSPSRAHRHPCRSRSRREASRPPLLKELRLAQRQLDTLGSRLGFDPTSRSHLGIAEVRRQSKLEELRAKRASSWPPLHLTKVPAAEIKRGDGERIGEAIEALATVSKDGYAANAGDPLVLRDWQKQLLGHLFARKANGRLRHRVALIGLPRKNGKSSLGSALALDGLVFGGNGAEVYTAAAEKEQARIVFGETKRMIAADPELSTCAIPSAT